MHERAEARWYPAHTRPDHICEGRPDVCRRLVLVAPTVGYPLRPATPTGRDGYDLSRDGSGIDDRHTHARADSLLARWYPYARIAASTVGLAAIAAAVLSGRIALGG